MRWLVAGGCVLFGLACNGGDWVVAEESSHPEPAGSGLGPPEVVVDPEGCPSADEVLAERERMHGTPSVSGEHVGHWRGTLDGEAAAYFPSPELELELNASGAGTLIFDAPPALLGELDAGAGYLCGAAEAGVVCGTRSGFVGNFAYPLAGAQSRDGVLSFVLVGAAPWDGWCALQPPVRWPDPAQECGFSFGVRLPTVIPRYSSQGCARVGEGGAEPIDCALMYALERCQCARDACFATDAASMPVGLALSEDTGMLSGRLWYESETDAAVVALRRTPP